MVERVTREITLTKEVDDAIRRRAAERGVSEEELILEGIGALLNDDTLVAPMMAQQPGEMLGFLERQVATAQRSLADATARRDDDAVARIKASIALLNMQIADERAGIRRAAEPWTRDELYDHPDRFNR
jgi:hypothetical protein